MPPSDLLDRVLWTQLARIVHGSPPKWEPESAGARAIRSVLEETELDPEESAILGDWDGMRESSRRLFDRLLQARVNRALHAGARVEVQHLGLTELPRLPRVLIVREGGVGEGNPAVEPRGIPRKTVVEFLSGPSADVASLAPGAKLDQLVDLLVLANQGAAESLRESLGPAASILSEDELPRIDLLLAAQSPSIQVFDIERELARLEEVLRRAIPAEKRPAKSGSTWSFGQDLTGELLGGKYRIRALKGKGAFKTVYEGEDEMLGARVAVAVLNPKGARSPRALEHFQDEARKLTTLDHENIVRWITFDRSPDGLHYFVMEYIDGEELEKVLRREGRLAPKRAAQILLQVLAALRRAHSRGKHGALLHLDLKPENVFVLPPLAPGEPERVKVIDFGIGQHVGAEVRAAEHPELRTIYDLPTEELGRSVGSLGVPEDEAEERASVPHTGRVQRARGGTLLYASPEQCKHLAGHKDIAELDGRSDLYSLGVMAFRMLTGQFPFARLTTAYEAIQNHLEMPPRRVGSLGIKIPRDLAAFVDRCLVKERDRRWRDASEAHEVLARIVQPRLSPAKVSLPLALVGALGVGALYFTRDPLESQITLIDPAIAGVSERVVHTLYLGPSSPSRVLRLESDSAWERAAPLRLLDADGGGELAGWSVHWADATANALELSCLDGAESAAALLEIDGGRRTRWRSGRLALNHLGPWHIQEAAVTGQVPGKRLDPRQRTLTLELAGDPEGCAALATIEAWEGERLLGKTAVGASESGPRYTGPPLDRLHTGTARAAELNLVARDRAGQEATWTLSLSLAGEPAEFGPTTGFVSDAQAEGARLEAQGETLLLPGNALRLESLAPATVRLFLEPALAPTLEVELSAPGVARVVSLEALGIAGPRELGGTLRVELDDSAFVARATSVVRTLRLPFRYTPEIPELVVQLQGRESPLTEAGASGDTNSVNTPASARLVVRTQASNLWLEARATQPSGATSLPARLAASAGRFELPLQLGEEGLHVVVVEKYLLLAGGARGPRIPPEHAFRIQVDRTPPVMHLQLEGAPGQGPGEPPLFRGDFAQRISAELHELELADLRWTLTRPDGSQREGALTSTGTVLELPPLLEYQELEGPYELELAATDAAGNIGRDTLTWQVARSGPELQLLEPLVSDEEGRWVLPAEGVFPLRVRAQDANKVTAVRARLRYRGEVGAELDLRPSAAELWELTEKQRARAFPWWTGKELALELEAVDGAGLARKQTVSAIVPEVRFAEELVITPRGRQSGTMVEIAAGVEYVFGGRADEGRRPWQVTIPRDLLQPFYLDAREVTRAEFLAFLRSPGFDEAAPWSPGQPPDAGRRAQLEATCAVEPELPATEIAWSEARAYARWCGKRLPTLLEWEFAVRGPAYRNEPALGSGRSLPAGWPANLCDGPREWTATPERLVAEAFDFPTQCRRYPERLLAAESTRDPAAAASATAPPAGSHWVAGGPAGEAPSWSARLVRADAPGSADVGFRCALDRAAAHALLDRGEYVLVE